MSRSSRRRSTRIGHRRDMLMATFHGPRARCAVAVAARLSHGPEPAICPFSLCGRQIRRPGAGPCGPVFVSARVARRVGVVFCGTASSVAPGCLDVHLGGVPSGAGDDASQSLPASGVGPASRFQSRNVAGASPPRPDRSTPAGRWPTTVIVSRNWTRYSRHPSQWSMCCLEAHAIGGAHRTSRGTRVTSSTNSWQVTSGTVWNRHSETVSLSGRSVSSPARSTTRARPARETGPGAGSRAGCPCESAEGLAHLVASRGRRCRAA